MMPGTSSCRAYVEAALAARADKAQCSLAETEKSLMSFEGGSVSLFKTSKDITGELTGIFSGRQGKISVSGEPAADIASVAVELAASAASSQPDPANDISPGREPGAFSSGPERPDTDGMYGRLQEFLATVKERWPEIGFRTSWLAFVNDSRSFANSNGMALTARTGRYELLSLFCAKKDGRTSSFNLFIGSSRDLARPLLEWGGLERLLSDSVALTQARKLGEKFQGEIILSPEGLTEVLRHFAEELSDTRMISGNSSYKGKLGQAIAPEIFTLLSSPRSPELASGDLLTRDGFETEDLVLVEKGILKNYLLSGYGAAKTGFPHKPSSGGCFSVLPGETAFPDLVRSVKKGLLVTVLAGAAPNGNGDFSGIAKNSFYIEDGKILFPISDAGVSGNLREMLAGLSGISRERVNTGDAVLPWTKFGGVNISGI
ncbi:MAG: hypothetical protein A2089_08025 [Elusimicrobia bacterium GWD2_63_28]|nr:MAG: hypothetical protein A2089_08025 [Elusimicrobia bacterium GWD2_63_28]